MVEKHLIQITFEMGTQLVEWMATGRRRCAHPDFHLKYTAYNTTNPFGSGQLVRFLLQSSR